MQRRTHRQSRLGVRQVNCERVACGEGHFERLVQARVEIPLRVGFLGHAV